MSTPPPGSDDSRIDDLVRRVQGGELIVGAPSEHGRYEPENQAASEGRPPVGIPRRRPLRSRTQGGKPQPGGYPPEEHPPHELRPAVNDRGSTAEFELPTDARWSHGRPDDVVAARTSGETAERIPSPNDRTFAHQGPMDRFAGQDWLASDDGFIDGDRFDHRGGRHDAPRSRLGVVGAGQVHHVQLSSDAPDPALTMRIGLASQIIQRLLGSAPHARQLAAEVASEERPSGLERLAGPHRLAAAAVRATLQIRDTNLDLLAKIGTEDPHSDHRSRLCRELRRWPAPAQGVLALRALADWDLPRIVEETGLDESVIRQITSVWFPSDSESIGLLGDLGHWTEGDARRFDAFGAERPLSHLDDVHALAGR